MGIVNNKNIIYKNSKSFFWASNFLPRNIFNKVINIYSFCRLQDDIVDEGFTSFDKSEAEELTNTIKSYGISDKLINELMDGVKSDENFRRYKDNSELLRYCYKVAGVVGLMMVKALNIKDEKAKFYAIDLGIAMQLTNISRDVMQDYQKNRIYIPSNTEISESLLENLDEKGTERVKRAVENLLLKADIYYKSSLNGIRFIPISSRISILIALRIYQAIGNKIKKTGTKFLYQNIFITKKEKLVIIIKAILEFVIFFIIPFHSRQHNKRLHISLEGLTDVHY
tara:strand:+ start:95 stop:943 length:849 start_codon:yes stop_codon:yes gene_type:complete